MRYFRFLGLLAASVVCAATLPLTVSDISLMLRSGYSSSAVEQELAARHFGDTLDETKRKKLIEAGATPQLLGALTSGRFAAPQEEMEKVRRQREQQEQQRALANDHITSPIQPARSAANNAKSSTDTIATALKGNLVHSQNGLLTSYYDEELNRKKIYGLYFSAHWCPPCRKFTPLLVEYYNRVAREHPEFEIIFISADKTPEAMAGYMRDTGMPWPGVEYGKLSNVPGLMKYAGKGIPDLVIVDGGGKVLADSYVRNTYIGPAQVLTQMDQLLAEAAAPGFATR